jgi:protein tyrosine phosphatase (PTP) superfamily phosphohydrolase (DUF442 family)
MAVKDIFNFAPIDERISTGGQPTREQFEAARDEGYTVVINLAPSDENNALAGEEDIIAALGLDYFHIPMVWNNPKPEEFSAFCVAMEKVGNRKVLVHCIANYRVSAVVSSYAIRNLGWSVEQADGLVNKIWTSIPEYPMNDTWRSYIETIRRPSADD